MHASPPSEPARLAVLRRSGSACSWIEEEDDRLDSIATSKDAATNRGLACESQFAHTAHTAPAQNATIM
jgi:hypothetical protein